MSVLFHAQTDPTNGITVVILCGSRFFDLHGHLDAEHLPESIHGPQLHSVQENMYEYVGTVDQAEMYCVDQGFLKDPKFTNVVKY